MEYGPDLTHWEFWWEFNRDAYLPQSRTESLDPGFVEDRVVPALRSALA